MDTKLILKEVKLFKGISETDTVQDALLTLAISESIDRILAKMNEFADDEIKVIPERLTFIVRDVAVKRFNRLNSEGTKSDSEEGRSFSWEDYLAEYEPTLRKAAIGRSVQGKGIARFI